MPADQAGNGKDLAAERAQLRRRLAELDPKDRLEALLAAPDAAQLVQLLPAEDLYAAVCEVGLADSTEVVQLASPEQFRTFLDLGVWAKDRFDVHRAISWLRAARGDEPREFLDKVHGLDLEILELVLRGSILIHDRDQEPDYYPSGVSIETPDGKLLLEFLVEGAELSAMRALVGELIAEDAFQASRLLEAIRWELASEVEETAYQFRQARLADLGFPELGHAEAVFAFVEPGPPAASAARTARELAIPRLDYLAAALRGAAPEEAEHLEEQLRGLANSVLVVEAAEPGDPAAARRVAELVRDYLALGFEHLCGPDLDRASMVARQMGLRRVFQIGFSLTLKLRFRVQRLGRLPLARLDGEYLALPREASALVALRRKRPLRALPVEGAEPVPFRTLAELGAAEATIARAERQIALMGALLGGTPAAAREALRGFELPLPQLGVDRLFTAIVANALLDGRLAVGPVDAGRLPELMQRLVGDGSGSSLRPDAVERVASALEPIVPLEARAELHQQAEQALSLLAADLVPSLRAGERKALVNLPLKGSPEP